MFEELIKALIECTPFGAFCLILLSMYRKDITKKYENNLNQYKEMYDKIILEYKTIIKEYYAQSND